MPKFLQQFTAQILPPVWQLLTQTADIYVKVVVNQTEPNPFPDNDDGKFLLFSMVILDLQSLALSSKVLKSIFYIYPVSAPISWYHNKFQTFFQKTN